MSTRREFIAKVGTTAVAGMMDADELRAGHAAATSAWDTSWISRLSAASFRVVFNVSDISDGAVLSYASTFLDDFHEVHGTTDAQTRPVAVFRRLGTPMAFNDATWARYPIGEDRKLTVESGQPVKRNVIRDLKANLVPGAILVPSGIYALIRAQNAGCAFMSGT